MTKDDFDYNQLKIPDKYIDYFEGFDKLSLSDEEMEILIKLREFSTKHNKEAIYVSYKGGNTGICSSNEYSKVAIPININEKENIKIYHSHTDISALSSTDLLKLCNENVELISNITCNGYVYVIRPDSSYRPTEEEMKVKIYNIKTEIGQEIMYDIINPSEKDYIRILETMFRVARFYKWIMEGGKI